MSDTAEFTDAELVTEIVRLLRLGAARADSPGPYDELLNVIDRDPEQFVRLLATGAGMAYPLR
jgi:hypothetical protein